MASLNSNMLVTVSCTLNLYFTFVVKDFLYIFRKACFLLHYLLCKFLSLSLIRNLNNFNVTEKKYDRDLNLEFRISIKKTLSYLKST